MKNKKLTRILTMTAVLVFMVVMMAMPAFAASTGNVSGAIEDTWNAPAILFACLLFSLTAPTYIWSIL